MYHSEFCEVRHIEDPDAVFVKWKKFCWGRNYRIPLGYALGIMAARGGCPYIADTTEGFENERNDTRWVFDFFIPEAIRAGCRHIFFLVSPDSRLKDELDEQSAEFHKSFQVHQCVDLEEVRSILALSPEVYASQNKMKAGEETADGILIRPMKETDPEIIKQQFEDQGWPRDLQVLKEYLEQQNAGKRRMFIAEYEGMPAGYLTLAPQADSGPFAGAGIPELKDFNVFEKFQRKGIGTRLIEAAEQAAAQSSRSICLGVGLHSGYGPAQRMYVQRGYVPDGSGVWQGDAPAKPYGPCQNDDELVLYMKKDFKSR